MSFRPNHRPLSPQPFTAVWACASVRPSITMADMQKQTAFALAQSARTHDPGGGHVI